MSTRHAVRSPSLLSGALIATLLAALLVVGPTASRSAAVSRAVDVVGFCDVPEAAYFAPAAAWARSVGLVVGVSPGSLGPYQSTTRAQFVTLLYRYETWRTGTEPAPGPAHGFDDVTDPSAYFEAPLRWAKANGLTTGTSPTTFDPDGLIDRAQLATFIHRLSGAPPSPDSTPFDDVPSGVWYSVPVAWMSGTGLTTGTSPTTFSPTRIANRAEAVTLLWRHAGSPDPETADLEPDCPPTTFTAFGDSVMLGAALEETLAPDSFEGWSGTIDIAVCRWPVMDGFNACGRDYIPSGLSSIRAREANGTLGDVVIMHLGTNGGIQPGEFDLLMDASSSARATWFITVQRSTGAEEINEVMIDGVERWRDRRVVGIIDWYAASEADPGLLTDDSTHLSLRGRQVYADLIEQALAVS